MSKEVGDQVSFDLVGFSSPRIPETLGEVSWLVARCEQLVSLTQVSGLSSVRISCKADLADRLKAGLQGAELGVLTGVELSFLPVDDVDGVGGEWADFHDDISFELDFVGSGFELFSAFGLAYPGEVDPKVVETRWVLQTVDGMAGAEAEKAARGLR
ncbi:MAG: hypothetical protein ACKOW9_00680 [Candidatus Paceibacterota bacterium]